MAEVVQMSLKEADRYEVIVQVIERTRAARRLADCARDALELNALR